MEIKVHAEVVNPATGVHTTTNEFYFTFISPQTDVQVVMPRTYGGLYSLSLTLYN